jgi:hypothetical protein
MKNLKIPDHQHERIKEGADKSGLPIRFFTEALVSYALDKLDAGDIRLQSVQAIEQPQPEEAA